MAADEKILAVVGVHEGKYFPSRPGYKLVVEARFAGKSLISDALDHTSGGRVEFGTELAWEMTRKALQEHKLQRTPIKLVCIAINQATKKKQEVGYVLLDLKAAQERIPPKVIPWYGLLRCQYAGKRPELRVSLTIEQNSSSVYSTSVTSTADEDGELSLPPSMGKSQPLVGVSQPSVSISQPSVGVSQPSMGVSLPSVGVSLPPMILDQTNGWYLLGSPSPLHTLHTVSFTISQPHDLHSYAHHGKGPYHFKYILFGNEITTEDFNSLNNPTDFHPERASIRIKTTPSIMKQFLTSQQDIVVSLCSNNGGIPLCSGAVPISPLASADSITLNCSLIHSGHAVGVVTTPTIRVTLALEREKSLSSGLVVDGDSGRDVTTPTNEESKKARRNLTQSFEDAITSTTTSSSPVTPPNNRPHPVITPPRPYSPTITTPTVNAPSTMKFTSPKTSPLLLANSSPSNRRDKVSNGPSSSHNVSPLAVSHTHAPPTGPSSTQTTVSTAPHVTTTSVKQTPPTSITTTGQAPPTQTSLTSTSNVPLVGSNMTAPPTHSTIAPPTIPTTAPPTIPIAAPPFPPTSIPPTQYPFSIPQYIPLGYPPPPGAQPPGLPPIPPGFLPPDAPPPCVPPTGAPPPPLLQPMIMQQQHMEYQVAMELEMWKIAQEQAFKKELKEKEEAKLKMLETEYRRRDGHREQLIKQKIEHYDSLENQLEKTLNEVEMQRKKLKTRELELNLLQQKLNEEKRTLHVEVDFEKNRLKTDHTAKTEVEKLRTRELTQQLDRAHRQIAELEARLTQKNVEMDGLRDTVHNKSESRIQAELSILQLEKKELEQKLDAAVKSKLHYKEQWSKALKEVSSLKQREQSVLKEQLKKQQNELEMMRDKYLQTEEKQLLQKQISDLRQQTQRLQAHAVSRTEPFIPTSPRPPPPTHSLPPTLNHTSPLRNDGNNLDADIARWIEERNILLQTGVYTHSDPTIQKLDKKIREALVARSSHDEQSSSY